MTPDLLLSLSGFALISAITPGPNNIMLMASGVNYGWRRSQGHICGVIFGFPLMVIGVGLGLDQLFVRYSLLPHALTVVSAAYLTYLAYRIATSKPDGSLSEAEGSSLNNAEGLLAVKPSLSTRPLSFWEAAAFQWLNPKAWVMALVVLSLYVPTEMRLSGVLIAATTYVFAGIVSTNTWVILGSRIKRYLRREKIRVWFNYLCAMLLLITLVPVLNGLG